VIRDLVALSLSVRQKCKLPKTGLFTRMNFPQSAQVSQIWLPAIIILFLLSGCNGTLPPVPKTVLVPVPVPCLDKMPERPKFLSDGELAAMSDFELVLSLRSDQLELRGHVALQEALLRACVK